MGKLIFIVEILLLLLLTNSCEKKETQLIEKKGDLSIFIWEYYENPNESPNYGEVKVEMEGTNPLRLEYTDTSRYCYFKNLPIGVYNIYATKEGFDTAFSKSFTFIGSSEPISTRLELYQKSSIIVENYDVNLKNDTLYIDGTLSHNMLDVQYPYHWPKIAVLYSKVPNMTVNSAKLLYPINRLSEVDDKLFSFKTYVSENQRKNMKYIALCGVHSYRFQYDFEDQETKRQGFGDLSEIKELIFTE